MSVALIIPAGGVGNRFSSSVKKQFFLIDSKPIVYWTLKAVSSAYNFDEIIFGVTDDDIELIDSVISELNLPCEVRYSKAGVERMNTVYNALVESSSDYVVIHDAVRPYVSADTVKQTIHEAMKTGGAISGIFAKDSVKIVDCGTVKRSVDRDTVFLAFTPQVFLRNRLIESYKKIFENGKKVTDDSSAYEYCGYKVSTVISNSDNIKITYLDDIKYDDTNV